MKIHVFAEEPHADPFPTVATRGFDGREARLKSGQHKIERRCCVPSGLNNPVLPTAHTSLNCDAPDSMRRQTGRPFACQLARFTSVAESARASPYPLPVDAAAAP
jgi:hypothetical protein